MRRGAWAGPPHTLPPPKKTPPPPSSLAFRGGPTARKTGDEKTNPRHTAPQLKDEASQLYPFVNKGKVDVSGGR